MASTEMESLSSVGIEFEAPDHSVSNEEEIEVEEEVEPQLKYERMNNDLNSILNRDAASCLAVHSKFIALGTHWGMIYILDMLGNNIRSQELPAHTTTVNQISIDENGDYMASCSDDGRVVINGLYTTDNNQTINFDRPIKAVAIDPHFFRSGSGKHFVTGDDKLILNEKRFLSGYKTQILHQGEGTIRNIRWRGSLIAWSNELGVKLYDMTERRRITFVARENREVRTDLCRCNLCWKDETTLIIGWARSIKVCMVKFGAKSETDPNVLTKFVEIVFATTLDHLICGIAPLGDCLVVLLYDEQPTDEEGKSLPGRPHLRVISANDDDEISNDALSIRGFQEYRCNDYHLESLLDEGTYFIVSPKDIVIARQRDEDDHVSWLLDHHMFVQAMEAAAEHAKSLKRYTTQTIGTQYFGYLISECSYDEAAALCKKILGKSKELWEEHVNCFSQIQQTAAIARYIPTAEPTLDTSVYEMVLRQFLETNHEMLYEMVKTWPSHVYCTDTIINAILDKLDRDRHNKLLLETLGQLYTYAKRYDRALYIFMRLRHSNVFELIHQHDLFSAVSDRVVMLMEFDKDAAVKMLLDNTDKIPVDKVVHQLEATPEFLHCYLDQLFRKDPHLGKDYHGMQVRLYAEYDRPRLMTFLRSSNYISLQKALEECQHRQLYQEMVFLLGRMGNIKQALQLIITELDDVGHAIEFCKEHSDRELWEDLINYSVNKPAFITGLLNNIGTHIDPIILIQKIRKDLEIPGLRNSLVQILHDYYLQISLREGCQKILVTDCSHLLQKLVRVQKKGISIDESQTCQACHERIIVRNLKVASSVVIFFCHHTFHEDCLPAHAAESCPVCSAQTVKRRPGSIIAPPRPLLPTL